MVAAGCRPPSCARCGSPPLGCVIPEGGTWTGTPARARLAVKVRSEEDTSPSGRQMDQFYYDWCYDETTPESMRTSRQLGLCDRDCCACDWRLAGAAYVTAPNGWIGASVGWPWVLFWE